MNSEPVRFDPLDYPVGHHLDPHITGRPRPRPGEVEFDLDTRRCPRCRPDLFPGDVALAAPVCCDGPAIMRFDLRAARAYRIWRGWPTEEDVLVLAFVVGDEPYPSRRRGAREPMDAQVICALVAGDPVPTGANITDYPARA